MYKQRDPVVILRSCIKYIKYVNL